MPEGNPLTTPAAKAASKRWHMEQRGITVDCWIDDSPETIKEGR